MNETQIIIDILRNPVANKRKKRVVKEIEPRIITSTDPVINKLAKKLDTKISRPVANWTNTDFLKHLKVLASSFGLDFTHAMNEKNTIGRLYDKFVHIYDEMSNKVLKDYLEWWMSSYGRHTSGREIYINNLLSDQHMEKFIRWYNPDANRPVVVGHSNETASVRPKANDEGISDQVVYDLGGLPMLLRSRGLVVAHFLLKKNGRSQEEISNVLSGFSKSAIEKVMAVTIDRAPYPLGQYFDFMHIVEPHLQKHALQSFTGLIVGDYFK